MRGMVWIVMGMVWLGGRLGPATAGQADGRLDIYWIDVEGGGATLVVTPVGESVLIDSGNPGPRDANRIFQVATQVAKLRTIDHLVTTHYHLDHYGGAAALSAALPIANVYDNGRFEGQREFPDQPYEQFKAGRRAVLTAGDEIRLQPALAADAPRVLLRCLAARQQLVRAAAGAAGNDLICAAALPKPEDKSDNANSIVLLLQFGSFRFFAGGDLTWNVERELVCPVNRVGQVDVYQVTHHGLDSSNNPVLVRSLAPTVAVMSNGTTKGCEPATFATLRGTESVQAIYQMHRNLRPDGSVNNAPAEQIANQDANCQARHLQLSVAPDGSQYTVSVSGGGSRTFATRQRAE
jgi:beta-lactamase superfamily II metal-dependent hydrolase